MKKLALGLAIALLNPWASAESLSTGTPSYLFQIHGSNTIGAELGPALVKAYLAKRGCNSVTTEQLGSYDLALKCKDNEDKQFAVRIVSKGSNTGFKAMDRGDADIVASSRAVKPKEIKLLSSLGDITAQTSEIVVALDAVVIIVNPNNPVNSLTINEIARIFKGQYGNWSRIGKGNGPIRILARDESSGTRDTFDNLVLGKGVQIYNRHMSYISNEALSEEVSSNKNAIGFCSYSTIEESKAISVAMAGGAAIYPDSVNISTEDYPLSRRLYFYMPEGIENPDAKDFLEFVKTDSAQQVVEQSGFIPVNVQILDGRDTYASGRYARAIRGYQRLSINIRFSMGGTSIDNFGHQSVLRLARFMEENRGNLLLLGFYGLSEGKNDKRFSAEKARKVSEALIEAGVRKSKIIIRGLGDERLLSSGVKASDNRKNIRIEVWFKPWFSGQ
ncbi:substrate-binding domain-containing protein [Parendozoicomonas sp. Alg238-R29]|uniref:substrate-binding domain-containing protein n=1 Tax=Parendozoicomonas sp. Alg238-R29 TaxID=2993446 RepID=UPI00248D7D5F|nr:substrate-binding domain-containing protein [Parendozoicomonas sp. Alg238-R29]